MSLNPTILRRLLVVGVLLSLQVCRISTCDTHNSDRFRSEIDDSHDDHRKLGDSVDGEYCAFQLPSDDIVMQDKEKMDVWRLRERSKSIFERTSRQYTIPVYFHVIQTSSTTGMVSDTRIRDFINYLNDSFSSSDVPFYFEYRGVTRTVRSDWDNCYKSDIQGEFKPALKIGGGDTLNIYICNKMYNANGASVTGYSTGPTSSKSIYDGVVINNDSGEARLNTLVHETVSDVANFIRQLYFNTYYWTNLGLRAFHRIRDTFLVCFIHSGTTHAMLPARVTKWMIHPNTFHWHRRLIVIRTQVHGTLAPYYLVLTRTTTL
jgi:hypothetical protein